jgi:hypothetical protein
VVLLVLVLLVLLLLVLLLLVLLVLLLLPLDPKTVHFGSFFCFAACDLQLVARI